MKNQRYMHIAPINNIEKINKNGILDNSHNREWEVFGKIGDGNKFLPVKGFVYDLEKIKESKYSRNAPWVLDKYIGRKQVGKILHFIPKYVDVYKVELFNAIIFSTNIESKYTLDNYMQHRATQEKIYYETAFLKEVPIIDPYIISGEDAAKILGLKPPYKTYRFTNDGFEPALYEVLAKTYINK